MPDRKLTLKVKIPEYEPPRSLWRKEIHKAAVEQEFKAGIRYHPDDRLEVVIRVMQITDIDNRTKDILDALLGRTEGTGKIPAMKPVIPEDKQIFRVIIEKLSSAKQSDGIVHLLVRKYRS